MKCKHELTCLVTGHTESATNGGWLNGHAHEYTIFCPICKEKLIIPISSPYINAKTDQDSQLIFNLLFANQGDDE